MSPVPPFWQRCLAAFREELTPQQFNTWIRPLAIEGVDGGYRLLAPNRFVLQWVKERFAERIGELAVDDGEAIPITLAVRESAVDAPRSPRAPEVASSEAPAASARRARRPPPPLRHRHPLGATNRPA